MINPTLNQFSIEESVPAGNQGSDDPYVSTYPEIVTIPGEMTRNTKLEESFDDLANIDTNKTTAIISNGEVILDGTPAPNSQDKEEISLSWLPDPVHTSPFHPNAMTYDDNMNCLVLSLQGPRAFYRVNLDGTKLDEITSYNSNNTGISWQGDFYYYCIGGDRAGTEPDLCRYSKNDDNNLKFGDQTSIKDGYPLVMVDNYIFRGKSYDDGTEDWAKINKLEKVSRADPEGGGEEFKLEFNGVADLAYDGEYIWVLKESNKVSLYLFDKDGEEVDKFENYYSVKDGYKPCGLAYAEGDLYVLLYEEENTTGSTKLLKLGIKTQYYRGKTATVVSKPFYKGSEEVTSIRLQSDLTTPSKTEVKFFVSSDSGVDWQEIALDQWTELNKPSLELIYKIELETTESQYTPTISNLKIEYNMAKAPNIVRPKGGNWLKESKVSFSWNFVPSGDDDEQTDFEIQISNNESFDQIVRKQTEKSNENTFSFDENLGDGTHYWRIRTMNSFQGWSEFSSVEQFRIDSKRPTGDITINNGNQTTYDPNVILSLSAKDLGSGLTDMYISEDPKTPEESGWEAFKEEKEYQFSSDIGLKTIYVWYRDEVGQTSLAIEDSIELIEIREPEDKGVLGMGKVGNLDVFYLLVILVIVLLVIIAIIIFKKRDDDYYDDYDEDDEEEEEEDVDVLEKIRKKRKKEMEAEMEEKAKTEEEEKVEEEEEEQFEKKARGRYVGATTDDDFTMESSRYGVEKDIEEKAAEPEKKGPYTMAAMEDDFTLDRSRYGGPPSLDDFLDRLTDEPDEEDDVKIVEEKKEKKELSEKERKQAKKQIALLEKRRLDILDSLRDAHELREQQALEQQMGEIQKLIGELKLHLPEDEEEEEPPEPVPEEKPETPELMKVPSDVEKKIRESQAFEKKRIGGLGEIIDGKKEEAPPPAESRMSPEAQERLAQIFQQLKTIQPQQIALQNQLRQTTDPGQQRMINQQYQVLEQQKISLQQEAQRLQNQAQPTPAGTAAAKLSPETEERLAQIMQQLRTIQQQQMAIQNQTRQTPDPGQQAALNNQYQTLERQKQQLTQEAQRLQQSPQQGTAPGAQPDSAQLQERARQILQQLQVIAQQQTAIQNQLRQTADPGQQQALTQQHQTLEKQKLALTQEAQKLRQSAQTGDAGAPPEPPGSLSPETEAKLKQILQQLQALQQQQMALQNQIQQTQDPAQKQALTQQLQINQQQAQALTQQAEVLQKGGTPQPPAAPTPPAAPAQPAPQQTSPETQAKLQQILQQLQALGQQQAAIQNQLAQTRDPGQQQALAQQLQINQQQAAALQQQAEGLQAGGLQKQAAGQPSAPTAAGTPGPAPQAPAPQQQQQQQPQQQQQQAAQLVQQYQALQQQAAAIQNQLRQTTDPGQQQALTQQFQAVQQQLGAYQQKIQQMQAGQ